jgi:hypothetical protein
MNEINFIIAADRDLPEALIVRLKAALDIECSEYFAAEKEAECKEDAAQLAARAVERASSKTQEDKADQKKELEERLSALLDTTDDSAHVIMSIAAGVHAELGEAGANAFLEVAAGVVVRRAAANGNKVKSIEDMLEEMILVGILRGRKPDMRSPSDIFKAWAK